MYSFIIILEVEAPLFALIVTKEVGIFTTKHSYSSSWNDDVHGARSWSFLWDSEFPFSSHERHVEVFTRGGE
jgi:hypothetical protein